MRLWIKAVAKFAFMWAISVFIFLIVYACVCAWKRYFDPFDIRAFIFFHFHFSIFIPKKKKTGFRQRKSNFNNWMWIAIGMVFGTSTGWAWIYYFCWIYQAYRLFRCWFIERRIVGANKNLTTWCYFRDTGKFPMNNVYITVEKWDFSPTTTTNIQLLFPSLHSLWKKSWYYMKMNKAYDYYFCVLLWCQYSLGDSIRCYGPTIVQWWIIQIFVVFFSYSFMTMDVKFLFPFRLLLEFKEQTFAFFVPLTLWNNAIYFLFSFGHGSNIDIMFSIQYLVCRQLTAIANEL